MTQVTELGRSQAQGFEICLRRRDEEGQPAVHELVVNGAFAMDSMDHSSEDALADCVPPEASSVLVAGLGLGYTALRVLERCPHARIHVVELSGDLIGWARAGLTPELAALAGSDRVLLVEADIADVIVAGSLPGREVEQRWDAILLDVDNGPDFLIHDHNDALYRTPMLRSAADLLSHRGLLAIWCQQANAGLTLALEGLPGRSAMQEVSVQRGRHLVDYAIHCWWPQGLPDQE